MCITSSVVLNPLYLYFRVDSNSWFLSILWLRPSTWTNKQSFSLLDGMLATDYGSVHACSYFQKKSLLVELELDVEVFLDTSNICRYWNPSTYKKTWFTSTILVYLRRSICGVSPWNHRLDEPTDWMNLSSKRRRVYSRRTTDLVLL